MDYCYQNLSELKRIQKDMSAITFRSIVLLSSKKALFKILQKLLNLLSSCWKISLSNKKVTKTDEDKILSETFRKSLTNMIRTNNESLHAITKVFNFTHLIVLHFYFFLIKL